MSVLICFSNLSDPHISKLRMKIPGTLERGKNTNQKNIFQAVFKLKCKVD